MPTFGEKVVARAKKDQAFKHDVLGILYKRLAKEKPNTTTYKKLSRAITALENIRSKKEKK
jgi:hypothetical protein